MNNAGMDAAPQSQPHVVIVGGGFGGLSAAQALRHAAVRVTVIDRNAHHLFQPLLYQVATAALSSSDIAEPIRAILRRQENAGVLMGEVTGVDKTRREVLLRDHASISYDYLVIATGARHSYFGREDWERFAPGLKTLEDARAIRNKLLLAFEGAELEDDPARRQALLTFVVVGGGPTGVEMAGSIAELAYSALPSEYRHFDSRSARIILIQSGDKILQNFPNDLIGKAQRDLKRLGVEVRTGEKVDRIDENGVRLKSGEEIASRSVFWAAGITASAAGRWLQADTDRAGRVWVDPDLSLRDQPEIFVIGDTAHIRDQDLPGIAPVAKQQGHYVAEQIAHRIQGQSALPHFQYRNQGQLATIGRASAIADFGRLHFDGRLGWLLWLIAHIYFLIGFENRLSVMIQWGWSYFTYRRGARLITLQENPQPPS